MTILRTSILALTTLGAAPALADITLYSGRGETLVAPIIQSFTETTGINVNVRYGNTAELAILLQEEGGASPADLYWAQDVAALGTVADMFAPLPEDLIGEVDPRFRDREGRWTGTSGRARVMIYSSERVTPDQLPATMADVVDVTDIRFALPPTNGSFLAHVTALRESAGEDYAREWLEGVAALNPVIVSNNMAAHQAIADGDADFALTNNYYLSRFLSSDPEFPVRQAQFQGDDIGNLMMVAGIGIPSSSDHSDEAEQFVRFLLSPAGQQYFAGNTNEYPLIGVGIPPVAGQGLSFSDAVANSPDVDLNAITDLEGTLELLREVGLL